VAICNILEKKYKIYELFTEDIKLYWNKNKNEYFARLEKLKYVTPKEITQPVYDHTFTINYDTIYNRLLVFKDL
jgi:hypothetical protein